MGLALVFGLAASSALVIGAVVGVRWSAPKKVTAVLLAFASGALISALAFELFEEAFTMGGAVPSGLGLLAGAVTFVVVDTALDRYLSGRSRPDERDVSSSGARKGVGLALLAAVTLDGVPENVALGVSLVGGASLSLLAAIFFSNLPEALVSAVAMREAETHTRTIIVTWVGCAALLAVAVVLGRLTAGALSEHILAIALAFAGGAVLASLADTLMPEAFEHGRDCPEFS